MLDDLEALVMVESPSGDAAALEASARIVADVLRARLGVESVIVPGPRGPHVRWSGGGEPRVLILGHHDTVFPTGTVAQRPFTVTGDRVTGPGVFDMLTGLVQAIHAVAALEDPSGVEILITADEETGSATSRALIEQIAAACGTCLVLEGAGPGGALKTARKGCGTFHVELTGRAAHAGLEPENGINALVEAAHIVLWAAALADREQGTTVTPTLAQAGTAENTVPATARVSIDVRVTHAQEKQRIETAFATLQPTDPRVQVSVRGGISRPPMDSSTSTQLLVLAQQFDPDITGISVGGGSDGNFTAAIGVPTLDGLGAVGGGAHADDEHVLLHTIEPRTQLIHHLLHELTTTPKP